MEIVSGFQIKAGDIAFNNNDPQNTQKTLDISIPESGVVLDNHEVILYNPSTATDITVKVFTQKNINGTMRYALLKTLDFPKAVTTKGTLINCLAFRVQNMFLSGNCRLVFSNDTALGAAEGFTASYFVTEII